MSSVWRKTLIYLGLVEETEGDELPQRFEEPRRAEPTAGGQSHHTQASNVRPLRVPEPGSPHVRAMNESADGRVAVVEVGVFEDAEKIGARYRSGQAVLFDLSRLEATEARRILDFVSGITYALRGRLSKAGRRAFLLAPDGYELPSAERRRLADLGYDVQG